MGAAFARDDNDYTLELVRNIRSNTIKNADEIMDAIKEYRIEIAEQIENLEAAVPYTEDVEKQIAVLIRQDQYLKVLESKQKYELAEIFFETKEEDNCIVPEILQWYQPPQEW